METKPQAPVSHSVTGRLWNTVNNYLTLTFEVCCTSNLNSRIPICMTESELYKSLGELTRNKERWKEGIPYVASLLTSDSVRIQAKALWMLGEMGLAFPDAVKSSVHAIAFFLNNDEPLLRERALNALGRIGRSCFKSIEAYWPDLFRFAKDEAAGVRLAFIWASENIATNTPDSYRDHMPVFAGLLHDGEDKVRMEAPRSSGFWANASPISSCLFLKNCAVSQRLIQIAWSGSIAWAPLGQRVISEKSQ